MKKIMLIASAMSALSLPLSASAMEFGDEGGLECGPYGKVGIVGGMLSGVESNHLDSADPEGKKHLSLTTGVPFGGTLAAGMTITPGIRAEIGVMYLTNVKADVELGKGETGANAGASAAVIRKHKKMTPPQPVIMPISIADRNIGVDVDIRAQAAGGQPQLTVEERAADRIAWLKDYAGIEYMVKDPNNPGHMMVNPVLLNIPQGAPNANPRQAAQPCDILDHDHWRHLVVGVAAMSNANKPSTSAVKVLGDQISKIYRDIAPFAEIAHVEIPDIGLPSSASVEQIQSKMQELNEVLESVRDGLEGYVGNTFANQIQLNFRIPQQAQQQQGQGQQQQAQSTAQEAAAAAAVRVLNGNEQIIQLYKDIIKLQRHAGIRKAMEEFVAAQQEKEDQGEGDCKKRNVAAENSKTDSSKEEKGKETEFDLSMIVGQVKVYADLVTTESFSIYAGAGAGAAYTYGKIDDEELKKTNIGMVISGALGVAINAAEGVYVDIEGGYMHSFDKIDGKYSISAFMANVGVRYNF